MKRWLMPFIAVLFLATGMAFAQVGDVTVSGFGSFSNGVVGYGLAQDPTNSIGALLSGRFNFGHFSAIEANYGYTKNSQQYGDAFGTLAEVQARVHEITGAYVYRIGFGRIQPFALAGAGVLIFDPTSNNNPLLDLNRQTRPAFLYGLGTDVRLTKLLSLRAQYRGLLYKAPTFGQSILDTDSTMHTAEPSIGLVVRF